MKLQAKLSKLAAALAICALAGTAHAQQQDEERDDKKPLDYTAAQERLELEEPTIPSPDPNDGEIEALSGAAEQDRTTTDAEQESRPRDDKRPLDYTPAQERLELEEPTIPSPDPNDGEVEEIAGTPAHDKAQADPRDRHVGHDMQRTGAARQRDVKAVTPVGPPVVPVKVEQAGPAMVPVVPVGSLEGVETVTLETEQGPVVVVSYPGKVPSPTYNIDFSALDTDDDGMISRSEVEAGAARSEAARNLGLEFQVADRNGDGLLVFPEIVEWVY